MSRIDAVSFDTKGFRIQSETADERHWAADDGQPILVQVQPGPSTLLDLLRQPDASVRLRKAVAGTGAGLIELTPLQFDGWVMVRTLTKGIVPPASGRGRWYLGLLTIPFQECSVVVRTEAHEHLVSGVRESEVFALLQARGLIDASKSSATRALEDGTLFTAREDIEGWLSDPDDPTPSHLARCVADDAEYDSWIPEHPLSRVRSLLDRIQRSIHVAKEASPVTSFASETRPERWWRRWLG